MRYLPYRIHRPDKLALAIFVMSLFGTLPAQAAWLNNNLRNGLQMSVSGSVNPTIITDKSRFSYLHADPFIYNYKDKNGKLIQGTIKNVLADQDRHDTDERLRIKDINSANVWIGVNKRLNRFATLSGNVLLSGRLYDDERTFIKDRAFIYQYGAFLNVDNKVKIGINNGNAYTAHSAVATSNTYQLLDRPSSLLSVEYSQIPRLKLQSFYALPVSGDTRRHQDVNTHGGYGFGAQYTWEIAPRHTLSAYVGNSSVTRHAQLKNNKALQYSTKKGAQGVGLSYNYGEWTLSADAQRAKDSYHDAIVRDIQQESYGASINYNPTAMPRLSMYAKYGEKNSNTTTVSGDSVDFQALLDAKAGVDENMLFHKVEQNIAELGARYTVWKNFKLHSSVEQSRTTNYISEGAFSKRNNTTLSVGAQFNF